MSKPKYVIWVMPAEAAATLEETLSMDLVAGNFDAELQTEIGDAMDRRLIYHTNKKPTWPNLKV